MSEEGRDQSKKYDDCAATARLFSAIHCLELFCPLLNDSKKGHPSLLLQNDSIVQQLPTPKNKGLIFSKI